MMENFRIPEKENVFEHGLKLGGMSVHKLDALREACVLVGIDIKIIGIPVESGINAQPYGFDETYEGAMNRAKNAQTENSQAVVVGIESGIIPIGDKFIDMAVVVVLTSDGRSFVSTSAGVEFPRDVVETARTRGFKTTTAGSIVAEIMGGSGTDPHSTLTGGKVTRKELLTEAIITVLSQVLASQ